MVTARRRMRTSAALVAAAVVLAGCSSTVAGTPIPVGPPGLTSPQAPPSVPTTVEPTVEPVEPIDLGGPSGPRDRPRAKLDVEGATDSEYDTQAINTIADLYDFYEAAYPEAFDDEPFEPVDLLVSYDAEDPDAE